MLDPQGKIGWGRSDIGGDPIVVVLSEAVSDAHLAGLRGCERIVRPIDRPRRDQVPHQPLWIEAKDFGERCQPCLYQFMLAEVGHRFRRRRLKYSSAWLVQAPSRE